MLKLDQNIISLLNNFDSAVIVSIEETLDFTFGEMFQDTFFKTLSLKGCNKNDIPQDPGLFRDLVYIAFPPFMHMPEPLFLRVILKRLSENLHLKYNKERSYHFVPYFYELQEAYLERSGGDIT